MKKLLAVMLSSLFVLGFLTQARAEDSANTYEAKNRSFQVFVSMFNSDVQIVPRDTPVVINGSLTLTTGNNGTLGGYFNTTGTTDSIYVLGVTDEQINPGQMGRVCVRGPHKVVTNNTTTFPASGTIMATSTTQGKAAPFSTADGTAAGRLGWSLSAVPTTETGDAAGTLWIWVAPEYHK